MILSFENLPQGLFAFFYLIRNFSISALSFLGSLVIGFSGSSEQDGNNNRCLHVHAFFILNDNASYDYGQDLRKLISALFCYCAVSNCLPARAILRCTSTPFVPAIVPAAAGTLSKVRQCKEILMSHSSGRALLSEWWHWYLYQQVQVRRTMFGRL